jgi:hypothetical protein
MPPNSQLLDLPQKQSVRRLDYESKNVEDVDG